MTTGAGLYISPAEKDPIAQNNIIRQLIEGRSNAVGEFTLDSGVASTSVTAVTCGPNSAVFITPKTAHAASALAAGTAYVSSVIPGQFWVSHSSTASTDLTFFYACFG